MEEKRDDLKALDEYVKHIKLAVDYSNDYRRTGLKASLTGAGLYFNKAHDVLLRLGLNEDGVKEVLAGAYATEDELRNDEPAEGKSNFGLLNEEVGYGE